MAKKRKKKNYAARRIILLLLLLALIGFAVWKIVPLFSAPDSDEESSAEEQVSSETESKPSSQEEESQDESSAEESEPEPSADESETESSSEESEDGDSASTSSGDWNLLVVNNANALPDGFTIELETLEDGYQVDRRIADAVREMYTKAREDGIILTTCSAYRSKEKQEENYNNQIQAYLDQGDTQEEAEAKTAAYYATPGYSEHHTGLAVDIVTPSYTALDEGYAETPAARWLVENAHLYGFVLRYPKDKVSITGINFEPWHYRYVGKEHAAIMVENNYCLEEYQYVRLQNQLEQAQQMDVSEEIPAEASA